MIADTLNENKPNETGSTGSPRNTENRPVNTIQGIMRYPMLYDRLWWVWMYLLEDALDGNTASSSPENTGFDPDKNSDPDPNPDTDIGTDADWDFDADPAAADDMNTPDPEAGTNTDSVIDSDTDTDTDTDIDTALKLWKYFYLPDPVSDSLPNPPECLFPGSLPRQSETAV